SAPLELAGSMNLPRLEVGSDELLGRQLVFRMVAEDSLEIRNRVARSASSHVAVGDRDQNRDSPAVNLAASFLDDAPSAASAGCDLLLHRLPIGQEHSFSD